MSSTSSSCSLSPSTSSTENDLESDFESKSSQLGTLTLRSQVGTSTPQAGTSFPRRDALGDIKDEAKDKFDEDTWFTANEKRNKMTKKIIVELWEEFPLPFPFYARIIALQEPANYGTDLETSVYEDMEEALTAMETKVTDEMNENLLRNFRDDEVSAAFISMFPTKAPGSDGMSKRVDNMTCPMMAKALAALDGIKLAQQLECRRLCIEGDAADIISTLKSKETNLSKIGHIVDEIKKLADSFQEVQILHVKRTRNNVAHSFAKEKPFVHDMRYWRGVAPDFVVPILLKDVPA
ncbi:hypothetical protein RJ639_044233 [Escallonia herrerae]|uniref:RNase H type-1 domain-containing protein n=1 Tax=Escallonia herrerae TaxID=1293975 RepID=A0AA88WAT4_9ASTE|nr:hypothetical protein RJ639_044233 [Escallonia herrerae]